MRYALLYRGTKIPLGPVPSVIGRSVACKVVLDDTAVSRRHVRLVLSNQELVLEDLGSANGVYVNDQRVSEWHKLTKGDRIRIGEHEFEVSVESDRPRPKWRKPTPAPLRRQPAIRRSSVASLWEDDEVEGEQGSITTAQNSSFKLLGSAADLLLEQNRGTDAEETLEPALLKLLDQAERAGHVANDEAAAAASYALKLARATGQTRWVEYCFDLFAYARLPPSGLLLDELDSTVDALGTVSAAPLSAYVAGLTKKEGLFGDTDRDALRRLRALVQKITGAAPLARADDEPQP